MNRTALIRSLALGLATLSIATASIAADDANLRAARDMAFSDAQVAVDLQAWLDQRDIALLAQADGLITNDMRADAEQYAIARLVEADGLVSAQLRAEIEQIVVAQLVEADGLVVDGLAFTLSLPESSPATRNPGAVVASATRAIGGR